MEEDGEALAAVLRCGDEAGVVVGYLADVIGDVHALDDRAADAGYPGVKHNNPSGNKMALTFLTQETEIEIITSNQASIRPDCCL